MQYDIVADLIKVQGCAAIVYGVYSLDPALGWIVAGIFILVIGAVIAKRNA